MEHFTKPKFFGKIKNPDVVGKAGNPRCGDLLTLYLKIDEKTKKIKDIKFETLGLRGRHCGFGYDLRVGHRKNPCSKR